MTAARDKDALQRLARLVTQRRVELGLTKIDTARAAGITITTYGNIEKAVSVRDVTYGKLEPVLGWAAGSCAEVLSGTAQPTLVEKAVVDGVVLSPVLAGDLEVDVEQAVQHAAIALEGADLTASDIRKLKQRVVEELRRRGRIPNSATS